MSRSVVWPPRYQRHSSGRAYFRFEGRNVYLGEHSSPESFERYRRETARIEANGMRRAPTAAPGKDLLVKEAILAYLAAGAVSPKQLPRVRAALAVVRQFYGSELVSRFGPVALETVRQGMIGCGWSRNYINSCIGCVKTAWRWAARQELIPEERWRVLLPLRGLEKGEGGRETAKVSAVDPAHVQAVLDRGQLSRQVAAMICLQLLTGMRPGELVIMRACDFDGAGDVRVYRPAHHKMEASGTERAICLGPQAQEAIRPFIEGRDPAACLFSPREASEEYLRAHGRSLRRRKGRPPGECYSIYSYYRAVAAACKRAGVPHWHPNQLRHTAATRIRADFGPEHARAVLGHTALRTTEIYAKLDAAKAAEVARQLG